MSEPRCRCATCGGIRIPRVYSHTAVVLWEGTRFCSVSCALKWCRTAEHRAEWVECQQCRKPVVQQWLHRLDDGAHVCPECHWTARRIEFERDIQVTESLSNLVNDDLFGNTKTWKIPTYDVPEDNN